MGTRLTTLARLLLIWASSCAVCHALSWACPNAPRHWQSIYTTHHTNEWARRPLAAIGSASIPMIDTIFMDSLTHGLRQAD